MLDERSVVPASQDKTKTIRYRVSLWYLFVKYPFCDVFTWGRPKRFFFSFSAINENADENEIPFTAENETKTKMDIHYRPKNESHLIILVFFFLFHTFGHQVSSAPPIAVFAGGPCWRDSTFLFLRYRVSLWYISRLHFREQFCFPGLLLTSESNFPQSMHCALLASL